MATYRCSVKITSPDLGGNGANVFHARTANPLDEEGDVQQLMDWVQEFYTDVNLLFSEDTTISWDGLATEIEASGDPGILSLDGWSVVGGTTTPNLPPSNCLCVTWRSSAAVRSGRGRTFLGPISRDILQDNGTPVEAARDTVVTAAATLIGHFNDPGDRGALAVYSETHHIIRDIVSAMVPNEFAVLRSRRD